MDIQLIIEWFKTSVLGIIILGAFGSILAIILIKLFNSLLKPLKGVAGNQFLLPILKIYYRHQSLALKYIESNERTKLSIYTTWIFGKYWVYSIVFIISLAVSIIFFAIVGVYLSFASFLLVTFNFLCLILWAKYGIASTAIREAVLRNDIEIEQAVFKQINSKVFLKMMENLDSEEVNVNSLVPENSTKAKTKQHLESKRI